MPSLMTYLAAFTRAQAELLGDKSLDRAERVLEECARKEQFILTMQDAAYPNRLRGIYDPPLVKLIHLEFSFLL